ncbi:MAG: NAD-binding protein [Phycisphaerales bacterium]|nr:NAD-binding protein [Phycisphaerales bacterium]
MTSPPDTPGIHEGSARVAVCKDGRLEIAGPFDWPEGTRFHVLPLPPLTPDAAASHFVVIAGFGLAGRYIAELLEECDIASCIIDRNPETISTQASLGRRVVLGDASDADVLRSAGISQATLLALTIPDEDAMTRAAAVARTLKPDLYILARAAHVSKSMEAMREGADEVITAEQEIALRFHERFAALLLAPRPQPATACG